LSEEHALRLAHLRNQLSEEGVRRFGLRLRVGFQLFVVLVASVVAIGFAVLLHDAITSHSVIIEPFEAAPELAAHGVSGKVVASGLLDQLTQLQNATRSSNVMRRDLSSAWHNDVKLAVPEAGISIGDISRLLKARFGHDLHIEGDLIETNSGNLQLAVRGDGVPPSTFTGATDDLQKLTTQAAEYVYSQSQPALWAAYLTNSQRNEEAIAFCQAAFASAPKDDRPYLFNSWANAFANTGRPLREALSFYRAALKIKPDFWIAHNNVMNSLWALGDEEGAWRAGNEMLKFAGGRPGRAAETFYENWDTLTWNLGPWLASIVADLEASTGTGTQLFSAAPVIGDIQERLHDPESAELAVRTMKADPRDPTIGAMAHFVRGRLASDAGDTKQAATEMEAFGSAYAEPAVSSNSTAAGSHLPKKRQVVPIGQTRYSRRAVRMWIAIAFGAISLMVAATGWRRSTLMQTPLRSRRTCRRATTLRARRSVVTATSPAQKQSFATRTSAGRIGLTRSKRGAMHWPNRDTGQRLSRNTTRR